MSECHTHLSEWSTPCPATKLAPQTLGNPQAHSEHLRTSYKLKSSKHDVHNKPETKNANDHLEQVVNMSFLYKVFHKQNSICQDKNIKQW